MKKNFKIVLALALALVLAFALVGCSGESDKDADGGAAAKTVVKIGIGQPLTAGAVAIGQGERRGALLAIKQANESAKAKELGIEFVGVDGDDMGDPKTGVNVANMFVTDKALVGVVGHLNSGVSIAASKVYNEAKVVMISPSSTNPELTTLGYNNVFRTCPTDAVQGPAAAGVMFNDLGFKKIAVVTDSTPYGDGLGAEVARVFEELGGEVAITEKTSDKDTNFTALATKIKGEGVDTVYYGGIYEPFALFAKQLKEAGVDGPVFGPDGCYAQEFIDIAGAKNAEGSYVSSVGLPLAESPGGTAFLEAFKAEYPNEDNGAYDGYAYDAANSIINGVFAAAEGLGDATKLFSPEGRDKIIEGVASVNFDGVTGKVQFDDKGDTLNKVVTVYQVKDGAWVPVLYPAVD